MPLRPIELVGICLLLAGLAAMPAQAQDWPDGVPHEPGVHPAEAAAARAAAAASGQTVQPEPQVIGRGGYSFFFPYPNGPAYGGYGYAPLMTQPYPTTPITTCGTGGCGYNALPVYGSCYTSANGEAWHDLVSWNCMRYDNTLVSPSYCQPPPSQAPCR